MKAVYEKPLVEILDLHTEKIANQELISDDEWFEGSGNGDWN